MLKPEHIYALLIMLTQSGIADNEAIYMLYRHR